VCSKQRRAQKKQWLLKQGVNAYLSALAEVACKNYVSCRLPANARLLLNHLQYTNP
jgi:hypothetical protein